MSEADEMRRMMLGLSKEGSRVFRNNVALAVVGDPKVWVKQEQRITVHPGDCVVRHARVLHAGLTEGSHDLIGWTPLEVTPALVGHSVAVFTSIEAKLGRGRPTPEQLNWDRAVKASGGIAGIAWSAAEAVELVRAFRRGER